MLGDFVRGFSGGVADLARHVRFTSGAGSSVLQVNADGSGSAGWHTLADVAGRTGLSAEALYIVGDLTVAGHSPAHGFGPLAYVASYDDLIKAIGADSLAAKQHYMVSGYSEGRTVSFDGLQYIASYDDLIDRLGANATAGADHFIRSGRAENRERDFSTKSSM